jgi:hypothetical protein
VVEVVVSQDFTGLGGAAVIAADQVLGELVLGFEQLTLESTPSLVLSTYIAAPASPTAERLQLLAAWTADAMTAQR